MTRNQCETRGFEHPLDEAPVGSSILVVDDDLAVGRAIARVLGRRGSDVVVVHDGQAAIDALLARRFDVILSDIQMPGMSGVDLLSIVRAYDLDVPVILMTGAPSLETAMEAVSLGALQRSFHLRRDAALLENLVETVLGDVAPRSGGTN